MKKARLFVFNVLLALLLAAAYDLAVVERRATSDSLRAAFLATWWASLSIGLAVGAGAVLGPRPALGWKKCVNVQVMIVLTSAAVAFLFWLLPREVRAVDRLVDVELGKRGLRRGSGIGAVLGTAWQIIDVYRKRRRAARST